MPCIGTPRKEGPASVCGASRRRANHAHSRRGQQAAVQRRQGRLREARRKSSARFRAVSSQAHSERGCFLASRLWHQGWASPWELDLSSGDGLTLDESTQTDMKLHGTDGREIMSVTAIEREGAELVIRGKVFGAMPLTARLKPEEARSALKLLDLRTALFILSLPFRRKRS
jgi:hypothetical protein